MVVHIPAAGLRANSATVPASFSAHIHDALTLDELTTQFCDAARMEGMYGYQCFAIEDRRRHFLFGDDNVAQRTAQTPARVITFSITSWDEMAYEVDVALVPEFDSSQARANLHAMATLYLCRSLALLDADDDLTDAELTNNERICHEARDRGSCNLDIADVLDRSVHAIAVHLQRADRKLGRYA